MKPNFTKGYTHIYTGNGKGKTSAALGLAFRAVGSGNNSIIIQFMKGMRTGEMDAARILGSAITIEQYGSERFCAPDAGDREEHRMLALQAYERARSVLRSGEYCIVVLDEILTAAHFGLISNDDILALMKGKGEGIELVLTGRGADERLIQQADLVTEMREIKHYYQAGVGPRKGIED